MIELTLIRRWFSAKSTIGLLDYNGRQLCYTLEDCARERGRKIPGTTAIPPGEYPFIVDKSKRFGRRLPLIQAVPGFEGVRIHAGNTDADTAGCILVGLERGGPDEIRLSRLALEMLMARLEKDGGQGIIKIIQPITVL